ncbi:hypothetical protein HHL24_29345 [Paraburkholderia sp. RP-4-7]|uniref:Type VI secretion system tube protein Hcp n=2 Tax=Paraburkholderia polaris TaxID=2728848 RepID=A0A848IQ75_9BURK|nr:hypothetical protein [Paraburkholderia polaris]
MAIPLYLWLKDEGGADIVGSSNVGGRIGSIEVLSLPHGIHTPVDSFSGRLMGTRSHRPLTIEKEIDKSSPISFSNSAAVMGAGPPSASVTINASTPAMRSSSASRWRALCSEKSVRRVRITGFMAA